MIKTCAFKIRGQVLASFSNFIFQIFRQIRKLHSTLAAETSVCPSENFQYYLLPLIFFCFVLFFFFFLPSFLLDFFCSEQ